MWMTKIQTFVVDEDKGSFVAWAKLKEYHREVIAADSNLKATYSDAALFLILSRSLPSSFQLLIHSFVALPILSNPEQIDMLVVHEMDIWDEGTKTENAYIAKSSAKLNIAVNGSTPTQKKVLR
jgi:hypothetical protein